MNALLLHALLAAAAGTSYEVSADGLVIKDPGGARRTIPAACAATALHVDGERLFLACGARGVAIYDLKDAAKPALLEVRDFGGVVVGFHAANGVVWVLVSTVEARLLATTAGGPPVLVPLPAVATTSPGPAATPLPAADQPEAAGSGDGDAGDSEAEDEADGEDGPVDAAVESRRAAAWRARRAAAVAGQIEGRVLRIAEEGPIIDIGADDGVQTGDHVAFLEIVRKPDDLGLTAAPEEVRAVGEVVAANREGALVRLGFNERVLPGDTARLTKDSITASRLANPRLGNIFDVRLSLRPFVGVGELALGTLSDGRVSYRFEAPVRLHLLLEPLGIAWRDPGILFASSGNVVLTFDHTYFEMGLGAGWSTAQVGTQPGYGVSLAQLVRFGTDDGLAVMAHNSFVLFNGAFIYGGTEVRVRIPLWRYAWLDVVGAGGASGYFYGEAGLRILLTGNGDHGSWFVVPSVGGGGLFEQNQWFGSTIYAGPMAGIAVEWRP